jgi:hypothetical protein
LRLPHPDVAIGFEPWKPFAVAELLANKFFRLGQQQASRDSVFKPTLGRLLGSREVVIDAARENGEPIRTSNCERAH